MFQFPTSPSCTLCIHVHVPKCLASVGFPIRISAVQWLFAPLRSFSQLIASFIGFWCQGIHPMLLIAWPTIIALAYNLHYNAAQQSTFWILRSILVLLLCLSTKRSLKCSIFALANNFHHYAAQQSNVLSLRQNGFLILRVTLYFAVLHVTLNFWLSSHLNFTCII